MAKMRSDRYSMARSAMPDRPRPSMLGGTPESSRSAPEQNPRSTPVITQTRIWLSRPTDSMASRNGTITSNDMAFIRSGRLSRIIATWGRGVVISTYAMARACHDPGATAGLQRGGGTGELFADRPQPSGRRHIVAGPTR
jgi:hypothetical protein